MLVTISVLKMFCKFVFNIFFVFQTDKRVCPYCSQAFDVSVGAVHMGTAHKVANLIYEASKKNAKTSAPTLAEKEKNADKIETKAIEPASTEMRTPAQKEFAESEHSAKLEKVTSKGKENRPPRPKPKSILEKEKRIIHETTEAKMPKIENVKVERRPRPKSVQERINSSPKVLIEKICPTEPSTALDDSLIFNEPVLPSCPSEAQIPKTEISTMALPPVNKTAKDSESEREARTTRCSNTTSPKIPDDILLHEIPVQEEICPKEDGIQQIFKEYIKFCKNRKLDSKKCDITWIHIFLTSGRFKDHDQLLEGITLISKHHQKLVKNYHHSIGVS